MRFDEAEAKKNYVICKKWKESFWSTKPANQTVNLFGSSSHCSGVNLFSMSVLIRSVNHVGKMLDKPQGSCKKTLIWNKGRTP